MNEPSLDWDVVDYKAVRHFGGKVGKLGDNVMELLLVSLGMIMVLWFCGQFMLKCHDVCYFQMAQQNKNKKHVSCGIKQMGSNVNIWRADGCLCYSFNFSIRFEIFLFFSK